MSQNTNLHIAKREKNDEFYTQLSDIENELRHYWDHFRDKVVYCNCDDPKVSNFYRYFSMQFHNLGLMKLIASCYKNKSPDLFSAMNDAQRGCNQSVWLEYNGETKDNRPVEPNVNYFRGDGDFRNKECIELLKQSDIVVTNPPFSLFRDYVGQLMQYDKRFLILGSMNAITYKEIFPLIRDNRMWMGIGGAKTFLQPDGTEKSFGNIVWYSNLRHEKRNEKLLMWKKYDPDDYPKYDNYDAIEVSKVKDIPKDYDGAMGVPISFLDKYNPEQFEIIGADEANGRGLSDGLFRNGGVKQARVNGNRVFKRIFIRRK